MLITYLARPFEQSDSEHTKTGWVKDIINNLDQSKIYIYDPANMEAIKTGEKLNKHIDQTHILFIQKKYAELSKEMCLIWFGQPEPPEDILEWMKLKRIEKAQHINMNPELWGDFEAVIKSDFIIAYLPKGSLTVGTHDEILTAMLFHIPVYLIMPNMKNKSRTEKSNVFNKTNYNKIVTSGGKWFWSVKSCIKYIKEKYTL